MQPGAATVYADVLQWLKNTLGAFYAPAAVAGKILGILILALIAIRLGSFIIRKVFEKRKSFKYGLNEKKVDTMASLTTSVLRYAVYIIAIVVILTDVFKMTSVLAAAGIGGVAIGFGAQSLIRDIISGFFIVMEDQYAVGDLITIDTMTGTVEELELRVTKLRHFSGDLYIIPNGEIKKVTNHTRGHKAVVVDVPLAYGTDIEKAFKTAEEVCLKVSECCTSMVEPLKVVGITEFGKETMNLRIMAKTLPNEQWAVEREVRKHLHEAFQQEDIGFPQRARLVVDGGLCREGKADGR